MVKSSVILLVLSFSALSTALICDYQNEPFGYTCHITNQTYTDAFEVITLEGTHLEGMDDEKVLVVRFSDSTIHFVPNRIFFKFVNITNLFMENVGLTRLNVNSFNNANKLKNIFMNNNQITQIHPYSLKRCPELNTIFLSNNLITSIEAQQFAHNSKIHTIVLSNNLIRGINPSFLWNIIGFTYIDLTGNRCIDQHIFAQNGMLGSSAENLRECYDCQCDLFQHLICVFSSTSCTVQRATLNSENLWFSGKYDTDLRDYNVRSIRFADGTIVPYLSNEVFQTFNNIRSLVITNVGLKTINRTSFMGADLLAEIHLGQNLLTSIPEDTFHDLQHLQFLELSQNRFETIEKKLFAENPELTQVYLSNNRVLKNIHPETFAANPKLLVVFLGGNGIKSVHADLFSKNPELDTISLSNNHLKSLPATLFAMNTKLAHLFLGNNSLEKIDVDLFSTNVNLRSLNLNVNSIKSFDPKTFRNNFGLENLVLEFNQLENFDPELLSYIAQLEFLHLANNKLTDIHEDSFKFNFLLERIFLYHNQITSFHPNTFRDNENLRFLAIENNAIERIDLNFAINSKLSYIDMRNNSVNSISPNFLYNIVKLETLLATGNMCIDENVVTNLQQIRNALSVCFSNFS